MWSISDFGNQQPIFLILKSLLSLEAWGKEKKENRRINWALWSQIKGRTGMEQGEPAHPAEPWSSTLTGFVPGDRIMQHIAPPPEHQKARGWGLHSRCLGSNFSLGNITQSFPFPGFSFGGRKRNRSSFISPSRSLSVSMYWTSTVWEIWRVKT